MSAVSNRNSIEYVTEVDCYKRSLSKLRVRRFSGLFWPIFDSFCGGSIRSLIQPPQNESKTWLKRTQKSTEPEFRKRSKECCISIRDSCSSEGCRSSLQQVIESISACMWRAFCCKKEEKERDIVVLHPINGGGVDGSTK
jgi:hypothetical protein